MAAGKPIRWPRLATELESLGGHSGEHSGHSLATLMATLATLWPLGGHLPPQPPPQTPHSVESTPRAAKLYNSICSTYSNWPRSCNIKHICSLRKKFNKWGNFQENIIFFLPRVSMLSTCHNVGTAHDILSPQPTISPHTNIK